MKFIDIKGNVNQLVPVYNLRNAKYPDADVPVPPPSPQRPFGPEPSQYDLRLGTNPVNKKPAGAQPPEPEPSTATSKPYNLKSAPVFPPKPAEPAKDPDVNENEKDTLAWGSLQLKSVVLKKKKKRSNH